MNLRKAGNDDFLGNLFSRNERLHFVRQFVRLTGLIESGYKFPLGGPRKALTDCFVRSERRKFS
jgi:hypothetical protein